MTQGCALRRFSRRGFIRSGVLAAAALPILAACAAAAPPAATPAAQPTEAAKPAAPAATAPAAKAAAAGAPVAGGELKLGAYRTLDNLDPAVYWGPVETVVTQLVFDSLIYKGNDNKYYPGLADSWRPCNARPRTPASARSAPP
ncbi:MAG TPA: hypothetical protein VG370_13550 [Chloroflexota bacterium]|jgi:ABC-type transport system substrate-binding protein|nr:hypothetical protein [Chloroflexota bacterium]